MFLNLSHSLHLRVFSKHESSTYQLFHVVTNMNKFKFDKKINELLINLKYECQ